ncbi:AAA family ATPase [Vibrio sp. WXL103]|uniref:AAA family ATPase n=1 Tax=Vibrio sp. WXL103 TaxID=3450710 RepID=UPI003EC5881C
MLKSLRVRNFRSFSNSDANAFVDIKPLTVLLGKNSSGKSSFLRAFPLLRQSVEKETTGPVLWFGSYVDFGAFSEVKNNDIEDDEIYFDFKLKLNFNDLSRYSYSYRRSLLNSPGIDGNIDLDVSISVAEMDKKTVARSVKVGTYGEVFEFYFNKNDKGTFRVGSSETNISHISNNQFIPMVGRTFQRKVHLPDGKETTMRSFDEDYLGDYLFKNSINELREFFHRNTSNNKIEEGLRKIGLCNKEALYSLLPYIYSDNKVFIRNLEVRKKEIVDLFHISLIRYNINSLLECVNRELSSVFENVRYIAPLRATAERYYRHQDLQVNEIDHEGSNLAMLLRSLPESQQREFSKWTKDNFGFTIRVEELGLHYALKIQNMYDSHEYNINDMGFGFSQILPIVASIWFETTIYRHGKYRYRRNRQLIFTIEQPELHLHPEYQARLAKLFAKVVSVNKKNGNKVCIIFETHSKTMIDALGECIEDGEISEDSINIVVFDKGENNKFTNITFSQFDGGGDLVNWPVGFFSSGCL